MLGWVVSGTWTNINQFNAIRRDSDKIVGELNRQVEAHSEVKVNYVTWGLSDALGLTNSQAFVDVAKGDTAFTLACADLSKACVTIVAAKGAGTALATAEGAIVSAAPVVSKFAVEAPGKAYRIAVTFRVERGQWKDRVTGEMTKRVYHFHLGGKRYGLGGHHLPYEMIRWWKNLLSAWDRT